MIVALANTVVYPDTVVVLSSHTNFAGPAMFAPGRLREVTCGTFDARMKEHTVIGVYLQSMSMIFPSDCPWVFEGSLEEVYVYERGYERDEDMLRGGQARPGCRNPQEEACGEEE
jgi:hypothetical protein